MHYAEQKIGLGIIAVVFNQRHTGAVCSDIITLINRTKRLLNKLLLVLHSLLFQQKGTSRCLSSSDLPGLLCKPEVMQFYISN